MNDTELIFKNLCKNLDQKLLTDIGLSVGWFVDKLIAGETIEVILGIIEMHIRENMSEYIHILGVQKEEPVEEPKLVQYTCVGCGYATDEPFNECPMCHQYDSDGKEIIQPEPEVEPVPLFKCAGCGWEQDTWFDECPNCHEYSADGLPLEKSEPTYCYEDFEGTALEFEQHFELLKGFYVYYDKLRENELTDENIYYLFRNNKEIFGFDTTVYELAGYLHLTIKNILDCLSDSATSDTARDSLFQLTNIDDMRKLVQVGIEKEETNPNFYAAVYLYFCHGHNNGYFEVKHYVNGMGIDFRDDQGVWNFFGNKKIQNYFNVFGVTMEQYTLWSNMPKVLEIRNHFNEIIKYCQECPMKKEEVTE